MCGALLTGLIALPALAQDEVPFIVTPDHVTLAMLELAQVGSRDHVIDLGSGDGRIVITAAKRFGARGLGVELVPDLVERSRDNARRAAVADRVEFRVQDLFDTDLAPATVVTMYLLPAVNLQLRPRLLALKPGTRIVSHDWDMGDWEPDATRVIAVPDKLVGHEKLSRVHLWRVPARFEGLWCGADGTGLHVTQRYQRLQAQGVGRASSWAGSAQGAQATLNAADGVPITLRAHADTQRLDLASAGGTQVLRLRAGPTCR